ncbi:hypothetical protein [Saprospira grandis]|uniref:Uncharacterized protein n=1 Tax=Saprospira grandis (strain Lewin) TaxID=984262 RepID=H6L081_SAPGL|nr:hypothetical protein [Saprospira grandis]AFC26245.1 hypothetical protein SGRA_3521 [Saprospira grandis str. Lewin]WBM74100.1 hypothetical protein OP864_14020 [Saprospira grandis]
MQIFSIWLKLLLMTILVFAFILFVSLFMKPSFSPIYSYYLGEEVYGVVVLKELDSLQLSFSIDNDPFIYTKNDLGEDCPPLQPGDEVLMYVSTVNKSPYVPILGDFIYLRRFWINVLATSFAPMVLFTIFLFRSLILNALNKEKEN